MRGNTYSGSEFQVMTAQELLLWIKILFSIKVHLSRKAIDYCNITSPPIGAVFINQGNALQKRGKCIFFDGLRRNGASPLVQLYSPSKKISYFQPEIFS